MALTPLTSLADRVVDALITLGGTASPKEVIDQITRGGFVPTAEDQAVDPDADRPVWQSRVYTARSHLGDDDLVLAHRGRWVLSAAGRESAAGRGPVFGIVSNLAAPTPPRPVPLQPSVISAALTDPRVQLAETGPAPEVALAGLTTLGFDTVDADPPKPVVIELNVAGTGGTYWAYEQLRGLFESLGLIDDEHPMPEPFDEYVPVSLPMSAVVELVRADSAREDSEPADPAQRVIHRVWPNFRMNAQIDVSVRTVKADAAGRAFNARGNGITWAVIDSGVDAGHPHFVESATLTHPDVADLHRDFTVSLDPDSMTTASALRDSYGGPGHGTGVASIIAGGLPAGYPAQDLDVRSLMFTTAGDPNPIRQPRTVAPAALAGMAPEARLVSLKVITDETDSSDTLTVMAALRYVLRINDKAQAPRIHGVNLSLGYPFDPEWFACGQSPLCQAVDRLVRSGVVVVVAAGNTGYANFGTPFGARRAGGLALSINDPGNADRAITVGATHRSAPHTYGVSYFSSKGPTGDGRSKPDLVAPGERITVATTADAPPPRHGTYCDVSGTSFAAPHVSGAAAAFLSVRPEFIGNPERVKQILIDSATPLGRQRDFEGAGLLDLMRALQSV